MIKRFVNLWHLSGHDFTVFCPNGTNCESCKRYDSKTKIFHAGSLIKNKQATIVDMNPPIDLFPTQDENGELN